MDEGVAMPRFEVVERIDIAAPAEKVWGYRLDYTTLPDYNPNVTGLERVDGGAELGVGAVYRFQVDMGAGPVDSTLRVREAVPHSRIVNDIEGPGASATETITVRHVQGGAQLEFVMSAQVPDGLDGQTMAAMEAGGRAQIVLELENIKAALEGTG